MSTARGGSGARYTVDDFVAKLREHAAPRRRDGSNDCALVVTDTGLDLCCTVETDGGLENQCTDVLDILKPE